MRLTSSGAYVRPSPVPKMPPGLVELMDGLTRDVLKNNPTNVFEFCANHMEKLLEIRDGPSANKPVSLDQKILKAQEKVRQRAKERQQRIDVMKLQAMQSNKDTTTSYKTEPNATQEQLAVPSLKAPIHHEQDLEYSSEIEISHVLSKHKPVLSEDSNNSAPDIQAGENEEHTDHSEQTQNINIDEQKVLNDVLEVDNEKEVRHFESKQSVEKINDEDTAEIRPQTISEAKDDITNSLSNTIESQDVSKEVEQLSAVPVPEDKDNTAGSAEEMHLEKGHEKLSELGSTVDTETVIKTSAEEIESIVKDLDEQNPEKLGLANESLTQQDTTVDQGSGSIFQENDNSEVNQQDMNITENAGYTLSCNLKENEDNNVTHKLNEALIASESQGNFIEQNKNIKNELLISANTTDSNTDNILVREHHQHDQNNDSAATTSTHESFASDTSFTQYPTVSITDTEIKQGEHLNSKQVSNASDNDNASDNNKNDDDTDREVIESSNDTTLIMPEIELVESVTASETNSPNETKTTVESQGSDNIIADENVNKTSDTQGKNNNIDETEAKLEEEEANLSTKYEEEKQESIEKVLIQKSDSAETSYEDSSRVVESDLSKIDDDSVQNNTNSMDLETAAVTIQKVFRSFMFKSRNSTFDDTTNEEHSFLDEENEKKEEYYAAVNLNKDRRSGITRMDTVLQTVNEEKSLSLSTDDSSTLSSAATTIQAHVRGFLLRNRLNSNTTVSLANSHEDTDADQQKNKTILNIHIVPEEGNYLSRDESLITSMDLSLDGSPPSSVNLHPTMSYDLSERRKMLKREDAVQSISPPSNNSGKLSEDSVKEVLINDNGIAAKETTDVKDTSKDNENNTSDIKTSENVSTPTIIVMNKSEEVSKSSLENTETAVESYSNYDETKHMSFDESDVVTPYVPSPRSSENTSKLLHSGEFHDVVLPTKVSRNDTSVVSEFKNVLVYFFLWNNS